MTTVTDGVRKTKQQAETEGRSYEEREIMRGKGRGRDQVESWREGTGVFPAPDGTIYLVDINGTR